jgi:hypothetical protein
MRGWPALAGQGELDGAGWEDGTSPAFLQELVGWWQTGFDWRADVAMYRQAGGVAEQPTDGETVGVER